MHGQIPGSVIHRQARASASYLPAAALQAKPIRTATACSAGLHRLCPASTLSCPCRAEQTNNYDLVLRAQLAGVPTPQQQAALAVAKPIALALLTPRLNDSSQNYAGFTFGAPVPGL